MHFYKLLLKTVVGIQLLLLTALSPANAELGVWVGADYTNIGATVNYSNGHERYTSNPIRLKLGYRGENFGIEAMAIQNTEQTITDPFGTDFTFSTEDNFGLYLHMHERWVFARVGATWYNTTYGAADGSPPQDQDYVVAPTISIGSEIFIGKHFFFTIDYTYSKGEGNYPNLISGDSTNADVIFQGFGAGVNVIF